MDIQKLNETLQSVSDLKTEIENMREEEFESFVCKFVDDFLGGTDEDFCSLGFASLSETEMYSGTAIFFAEFYKEGDAAKIAEELKAYVDSNEGNVNQFDRSQCVEFIGDNFYKLFHNGFRDCIEDTYRGPFKTFFNRLSFILSARYGSEFYFYLKIDNGKSHSVHCEEAFYF